MYQTSPSPRVSSIILWRNIKFGYTLTIGVSMLVDFKEKTISERYHLMSSVIVPRPIAWIATEGEVSNIASFSYFMALSSDPATVIVAIGHRADGSPKDTLRNLRESKKCAICVVDENHFEDMHFSSKGLEANESELDIFDISTQKILEEYPAVPTGIKAVLFGEYLQEVDLKGSKTIPVIIEIKQLYVDESIVTDPAKIKIEIDTIARMGNSYRILGDMLDAPKIK